MRVSCVPCVSRHYPVGVLYDMYGRDMNLPWEITVHFRVSEPFTSTNSVVLLTSTCVPNVLLQNFPEDILLHCEGKEAVEAHFKSRLKEVGYYCSCYFILQTV